MEIPAGLKFTRSHEWVRQESDGSAVIGITHHKQGLLGDVVYVQHPRVGRKLAAGEACAVVESVKSAADVHTPVSGEIIAVNQELENSPEKINQAAYEAWLFRIKPADRAEFNTLLERDEYEKFAETGPV